MRYYDGFVTIETVHRKKRGSIPVITTCIEPVVESEQLKNLKDWNTQNLRQLENHLPVDRKLLGNVTDELGKIIQRTPQWMDVLQQIHNTGDYHMVQLVHEDNDLLNLPWGLAQDPISSQALGTIRRLALTKCVKHLVSDEPGTPTDGLAPPLKILVMISSPEDAEYDKRLSYEDEEFLILQAFSPLM